MADKGLVTVRRKKEIDGLYYITHVDNLPSILQLGVLSHRQVLDRQIDFTAIYNADIVSNRRLRQTPQQKSLWDYANLYFESRNAMLYKVLFYGVDRAIEHTAIVKIRPAVTSLDDVLIADGNAASAGTEITRFNNAQLSRIAQQTDREYWSAVDGSKRRLQAELLVPDLVPARYIESVYVASRPIRQRVESLLMAAGVSPLPPVIVDPYRFFQPDALIRLNHHISLARGDMFFSRLQTLTVSVNTQGVMGKGLASRAKYQFPDVYVRYQDLCKDKTLQIGKPALIKRESSIGEELAQMDDLGESTWFLLFPTKDHWKQPSRIEYIEDGMKWLVEHQRALGIRSLALPALGCGLGGLAWSVVGPLICSYADQMEIPVCVYLPNEVEIPQAELEPEFLLARKPGSPA